jgi:cell division protein FtsQ
VPTPTPTPTRNRKLPQTRPARAFSWRRFGRSLARRAVRPLAGLAVAGALAGAAFATHRFLMTSPRFALREIAVEGNELLSRDELLRLAAVAPGGSVFALSAGAIERRVIASPWIAEAEARRRLPDALTLRVVERRPAALLVIDDAGLYLADASGRPFKRAAVHRGEGEGLIAISGIDRRLYADGGDAAAALVRHALAVAAMWNEGGRRPALGEIHLARAGVTLHTLRGATAISLGRAAAAPDLAQALRRFDAIWGALPPAERAAARRIHLDSRTRPDRVTVSLAHIEEKR